MRQRKWVRSLRIGAIILWLLAVAPLWFVLSIACENRFGDRGFVHVANITDETYTELAKTDPMYENLPDGTAITAVYLRQMPGEAETSVWVTADDPQAFAQWLTAQGKLVQQRDDGTFAFAYLIRDDKHSFGQTTGSGVQRWVNWIYSLSAVILLILLLIPWENKKRRI